MSASLKPAGALGTTGVHVPLLGSVGDKPRNVSGLIDEARPLVRKDASESQQHGQSALFWLHDTTVMGWKEHDQPSLVAC